MKTEMDIFADVPVQSCIQSSKVVSYTPVSTITDDSPIEFLIPASDEYIDWASAYLTLTARIEPVDSTHVMRYNSADHTTTDKVGPVNLWLHSLFKQVDLELNGVLVSQPTGTYPQRAMLETLLHYGGDAKTSLLTGAMYVKDTAGLGMDTANPFSGVAPNAGLRTRATKTRLKRSVQMTGRLHLDLCQTPKCIVSGVEARLKLFRTSAAFNLIADAVDGVHYKTVITDVTFNVRRVTPFPSVALSHAKLMSEGNDAKYPVRRNVIKTFTVSKDNMGFNRDNLFLGQVPDALTVAIVKSKSYHGDIKTNPFRYLNAGLTVLGVYVNGQPAPAKPLTLDFSKGKFAEAFNNLFHYTGKDGNNITIADFKSGYSIFHFDLTADTSAYDWIASPSTNSSVRLEGHFSAAATDALEVIVMGSFMNTIEIDADRNVKMV